MAKFSTRDLLISIKNKSMNKTIKDLHIRVVASKTLSANPNQANIEIYNLNQDSREELFNNVYNFGLNEASTEVEVFFNDELLFKGSLINVNSVYLVSAAEWRTTLFCGDGFNAINQRIAKKYEKGAKLTDIQDDLNKEFEKAGTAISGVVEGLNKCAKDRSLLKAIWIDTTIVQGLLNLYKNCFSEIDVYVDDGKVNFLADKAVIKGNIVTINEGLIDPPTLSEQGINCKVVFNSSVKIGAEIKVDARSVTTAFGNLTVYRPSKQRISGDGTYRVQEIKHTVDNFSQDVSMTEIIGFNTRLK